MSNTERLREHLFKALDQHSQTLIVLRDVLALHKPFNLSDRQICDNCHGDYPCATVRTIAQLVDVE